MQGINPNRLREIRIMRNLKLDQLANALGVTKQAVSKYEHGKSIPSYDVLEKMLSILNVSRSYICKESVEMGKNCSPLFFRASSTTTKGHTEYASTVSLWGYEIVNALIDNPPISNFSFYNENMSIPEKAIQLRKQWDIGNLPIPNLTALLEQDGFYIFTIDSSELQTDAYSRIINGVPIIVVNKHKGTAVRWRFSLAHELGHLLLHNQLKDWEFDLNSKLFEQEANLFAQHFLMPSDSFRKSIAATRLDHFISLKKEWGVSISAMVYHCGQLGIIDSQKQKSLQIQIGSRGWRKAEPLDDEIEFEAPQKVSRLVTNQTISNDSFDDFYSKVCLPLDEIERICSIPTDSLAAFKTSLFELHRNQNENQQLTLFDFGGDYYA